MPLASLLGNFAAAVENADGRGLAACFTEDGVYHDTFYGEFAGRDAVADMLENRFWRDAEAFRWDFESICDAGELAYASWLFSYTSKLKGAEGKRVVFEGMCRMRLRDGLLARYDEIFDIGAALGQVDFAPERVSGIVAKRARAFRARAVGTRHLP